LKIGQGIARIFFVGLGRRYRRADARQGGERSPAEKRPQGLGDFLSSLAIKKKPPLSAIGWWLWCVDWRRQLFPKRNVQKNEMVIPFISDFYKNVAFEMLLQKNVNIIFVFCKMHQILKFRTPNELTGKYINYVKK